MGGAGEGGVFPVETRHGTSLQRHGIATVETQCRTQSATFMSFRAEKHSVNYIKINIQKNINILVERIRKSVSLPRCFF